MQLVNPVQVWGAGGFIRHEDPSAFRSHTEHLMACPIEKNNSRQQMGKKGRTVCVGQLNTGAKVDDMSVKVIEMKVVVMENQVKINEIKVKIHDHTWNQCKDR